MIFDSRTLASPGLPAPVAELATLPSAWIIIAIAYLIGAVPFGLLIAKRVSGIDLREFGSGNIGTSNAVRAMGRRWGFVVFLLDFLKGLLPVLACYKLVADQELHLLQVLTGTAAVLGHCYPIYLGFRGGKGVATGCGAIVAINPFIFVSGGVVWLITRFTTRYAGLASIMMGLTFPFAAWAFDWYTGRARPELLVGSTLLTILILVRHRSNMMRMLKGTEPRIGEKVENSPAARNHG